MILEPVAPEIWLVDGKVVSFHGFPYPTRSVVIRLPDGALWVWSPVDLTPNLAREIEALGPVSHLVSPNKLHHLYLADWLARWPEARLWGPGSTVAKRPDLTFEGQLGDTAPRSWSAVIDQWLVPLPPLFEEVVFLHRPSGTAIIGDLSQTFDDAFLRRHWALWQRAIARLWGITEDKGRAPLELRFGVWRRGPARERIQALIDARPERVVMAHGTWQREDGAAFLARAFHWLGVRTAGRMP